MTDEVGKYTAIRKLKVRVTGEHSNKPLNQVLTVWLTKELGRPVSKAKARKLVVAGVVSVNQRRTVVPSQILPFGSMIDVSVDLMKLFGDSASRDRVFELTPNRILFEDEDLIVVDKPPGLPAHATQDVSRDNLVAAVSRYLSKRDGIAKPYLGVHQRLDRDTSGIVLFTKSSRVNSAIAKSFSEHAVTKIYNAITVPPAAGARRAVKEEWTIRNYLGKMPSTSKRSTYGAVRTDGQPAETAFRILERYPRGLWIEAIPRTGRTHQIRVHLAEYGLPILGDDLYGAGDRPTSSRLMLHALQLMFLHPLNAREIAVESPLPTDFQECLRKIQ